MIITKCKYCPFFTSCNDCETRNTCKRRPPIANPGCCERQAGWFAKSGEGNICHYLKFMNEEGQKLLDEIDNLEKELSGVKRSLTTQYDKLAKVGKFLEQKEVTWKHQCGRCKYWNKEHKNDLWGKCSIGNKENWVHATDQVCIVYEILYNVGKVINNEEYILTNIIKKD